MKVYHVSILVFTDDEQLEYEHFLVLAESESECLEKLNACPEWLDAVQAAEENVAEENRYRIRYPDGTLTPEDSLERRITVTLVNFSNDVAPLVLWPEPDIQ